MSEQNRKTAYIDEHGVLHDPVAAAIIRAVERDNVRRMLVEHQLERVRHFEGRLQTLGLSPAEYLIVVLNVDDQNGAALADALMPGHDWSEIRARGEIPFARGLASRPALQEMLESDAAAELAAVDGVAVLAMDRGVITAFAASELAGHGTGHSPEPADPAIVKGDSNPHGVTH